MQMNLMKMKEYQPIIFLKIMAFVLVMILSFGCSAGGDDNTVTGTTGGGTTTYDPVTNASASVSSGNSIDVSWNLPSGATGAKAVLVPYSYTGTVDKDNMSSISGVIIKSVTGTSTSFTNADGVIADTDYTVYVSATHSDGQADVVKVSGTFKTSSSATTYYPVTNVNATGGNGQVSVSWAAPAIGTPESYTIKVLQGTSLVKNVTTADASTLNYAYNQAAGAQESTDYSFRVIANYTGGNKSSEVISSVVNSGTVPVTVPDAVSNFTADLATTIGTADLSWTIPNNANSVTVWRVAAGTGNSVDPSTQGATGRIVDASTGTGYTDNAPDGVYDYVIAAQNTNGWSSVTVLSNKTVGYTPVTNLTADVATTPGSAILAWTKPADITDTNISGYLVYREGSLIQTIANKDTLTYTDDPADNTTYNYTVKAYYNGDTNNASAVASVNASVGEPAVTYDPPTGVTSSDLGVSNGSNWGGIIELGYTKPASADSVLVYFSPTDLGANPSAATLNSSGQLLKEDTDTGAKTLRNYWWQRKVASPTGTSQDDFVATDGSATGYYYVIAKHNGGADYSDAVKQTVSNISATPAVVSKVADVEPYVRSIESAGWSLGDYRNMINFSSTDARVVIVNCGTGTNASSFDSTITPLSVTNDGGNGTDAQGERIVIDISNSRYHNETIDDHATTDNLIDDPGNFCYGTPIWYRYYLYKKIDLGDGTFNYSRSIPDSESVRKTTESGS